MAKSKDISLPQCIEDFCEKMDRLGQECESEIYEIHRGEDLFWDSLWDYPVLWSLAFGITSALLPIAGLLAWHINRGGTIFN